MHGAYWSCCSCRVGITTSNFINFLVDHSIHWKNLSKKIIHGLKLVLLFFLQFLSMKLATVNPELNIDIERILSKDVSHTLRGH